MQWQGPSKRHAHLLNLTTLLDLLADVMSLGLQLVGKECTITAHFAPEQGKYVPYPAFNSVRCACRLA